LALRTAKVSCLPLKSCARSTLFCSAQARLIIAISGSFSGNTASGASSRISSVNASILRAPLTPFSWKLRCDGAASARSIENTASSAVKGVPSWNVTPGRSLKRQVIGLNACQDRASEGSSRYCSSRLISES
jgi:hypothetical protein